MGPQGNRTSKKITQYLVNTVQVRFFTSETRYIIGIQYIHRDPAYIHVDMVCYICQVRFPNTCILYIRKISYISVDCRSCSVRYIPGVLFVIYP